MAVVTYDRPGTLYDATAVTYDGVEFPAVARSIPTVVGMASSRPVAATAVTSRPETA